MPQADIDGPQRKIIRSEVRPLRTEHGTNGIPLRSGRTLPFSFYRGWNAPSGYYTEAWFLVHPETREVLFEGPSLVRLIRGLPAVTDVSDEIRESFSLDPGRYLIVLALDGQQAAEIEVEAAEIPAEEAA